MILTYTGIIIYMLHCKCKYEVGFEFEVWSLVFDLFRSSKVK